MCTYSRIRMGTWSAFTTSPLDWWLKRGSFFKKFLLQKKATATNRMHSDDLIACWKKCWYFWSHSEVEYLLILRNRWRARLVISSFSTFCNILWMLIRTSCSSVCRRVKRHRFWRYVYSVYVWIFFTNIYSNIKNMPIPH